MSPVAPTASLWAVMPCTTPETRRSSRLVDRDIAVSIIIGVDPVTRVRGDVGGVVDDDGTIDVEIGYAARAAKEARGNAGRRRPAVVVDRSGVNRSRARNRNERVCIGGNRR